jgi:hypothetical protein
VQWPTTNTSSQRFVDTTFGGVQIWDAGTGNNGMTTTPNNLPSAFASGGTGAWIGTTANHQLAPSTSTTFNFNFFKNWSSSPLVSQTNYFRVIVTFSDATCSDQDSGVVP